MRALDLLRADHRHLQSLFERARGTADFGERREIFEELRDSLELHLELEDEVFYPPFQQRSDWFEVVEEALEDHRLLLEMTGELASVTDREEFSDLMDELMESIEDHLLEEEQELFPALLPVLTLSQWEGLAATMEDHRESSDLEAA